MFAFQKIKQHIYGIFGLYREDELQGDDELCEEYSSIYSLRSPS
jgi:hypothetical protein